MRLLINISMIVFILLFELTISSASNAADFTTNEHTFIGLVLNEISVPAYADAIPSKQIRHIVRNHLNPQMTQKLSTVNGVSLYTPPTKETPGFQVALLELVYPNMDTALKAQKKLPENAYFQTSKILTPFSSTVINNHLLIIFTETSGNQQALTLIKHFPEKWNQNNGTGALKE